MIRLNDREFLEIVSFMRENYGINLEKKKVLVECRLAKEVEKCGAKSFEKYVAMVRNDRTGAIAGDMISRLTTNYTYFMREPAQFSMIKEKILPKLSARSHVSFCSVWCAGCSTGEEAYTLAMLLQDYREQARWMSNIRVLGTDISGEVLERAEEGVYPLKELESLPVEWQKKYCRVLDKKTFKIDERLKCRPCFERQNLLGPVLEEKFDLVFCRNVMIYFDRESKSKLLRRLENSLKPGGYLFVGLAELLSREETSLVPVYPAVYKKAAVPAEKEQVGRDYE